MNPPLTSGEREMFHEIMAEIRHVRDSVSGVRKALDDHVTAEDVQYSELRCDNKALRAEIAEMREEQASQKTRLGMIGTVAGLVGAAVMAGIIGVIQKVFF